MHPVQNFQPEKRLQSKYEELPSGLQDRRSLPDAEFGKLWDAIVVEQSIKDQLLGQALLNFSLRGRVDGTIMPLHGLLLLTGAPGTGKTSLAKGLASRTAEVFPNSQFTYLEVDPHGIGSAALGNTQKAVKHLFGSTIPEYMEQGPTIILVDEIETLAADRRKLSLEANPIDVHRATDALLVQLDYLAHAHSNMLFVATSNFCKAIDEALISRADLVVEMPLPSPAARKDILEHTLIGMSAAFPELHNLAKDARLQALADSLEGADGRTLRKLVASACALAKDTAINPGRLTIEHLTRAAAQRTGGRAW